MGLRGSRLQAQLGAMHGDTRTNEVGEEREKGTPAFGGKGRDQGSRSRGRAL
jgi:hypothetical protein